jgi:aerobic carbon-monoxide dehydrogenase medium subunit
VNLPAFTYLSADNIADACMLLANHGRQAKLIAGGTDVLVKMKQRRLLPRYLIDLKRVPDLDYVRDEVGVGLHIGAMASIETLKQAVAVRRKYPVLHEAAAYMATVEIRNRATLVGNICNGSPSAETAPALMVLGASARVVSERGERLVALEDFFVGPGRTALEPDELVTEILVPEPPAAGGGSYEKYSLRRMDPAVVGAAAFVVPGPEGVVGQVRLVLSAVAPTPFRAKAAEALLTGRVPTAALIEEAARAAAQEARPITDVRASAEFRGNVLPELTARVIRQALKAAKVEVA